MKPVKFTRQLAASLEAAVLDLAGTDSDSKFIAGGQSLGPMMNLRLARPRHLIDISALSELHGFRENSESLFIGASTTHADIEDGKVPDPIGGMLQSVAGGIAYRAIRNRGTVGGSLAHADPSADWVTTLTTANAIIHTLRLGDDGLPAQAARPGFEVSLSRHQILMTDFIQAAYTTALRPGEMIIEVEIPKFSAELRWGYYKFCRKQGELAGAMGAVIVDPARLYCRVVAGATGGAPLMLEAVAEKLAESGSPPDAELIKRELLEHLSQRDPVFIQQTCVSIQRAILQMVEGHD